ncbi:MAG TPA: hypothetical protein PKA29_03735 [Candidatus Saccharibacteria bacterium]|nr:hypothetical protein [Candidatus Saccharibacteria bacterium]
MIEILQKFIGSINSISVLGIIISVLGIIISCYLYFKNLYRLVFSRVCICENNKTYEWSEYTTFTSRILFYNNGGKSITENEIKKLELKTDNKINSVRTIKANETIEMKTNNEKNIVSLKIGHLDSSDFFVLEINHTGKLKVIGRISETGKILNTEHRYWFFVDIAVIIPSIVGIFYTLKLQYNNSLSLIDSLTNPLVLSFMFIFFGMFIITRFIHRIFFIPGSVSSKYLGIKDESAKEFKN